MKRALFQRPLALLLMSMALLLLLPQTAAANDSPAVVNVAHFAPFAGSVDETSVTVRVNGADALTDFKFGDIAKGVELPAGDYLIEIVPTGTDTVAISGNVTVEGGVTYTLAAIGDGANQPLELFALVDDTVAPDSGAKLRIAHLAPFAADLDATQVDICTDDGAVVLAGVPYKVFTDPYLALPAGDYDLKITIAGSGCEAVALDLPSVRLSDGDIVDVFAIGNIANLPLQIATVTGISLTPPPAEKATITIVLATAPETGLHFRYAGDLGAFALSSENSSQRFTVDPGHYDVRQIQRPRWFLSDVTCDSEQARIFGRSGRVRFSVAAGDDVTCTFTNQAAGSIRVRVFEDLTGDARPRQNPRLPGWSVHLYTNGGQLLETSTTNQFGKAHFTNLAPGRYVVCESLQSGYTNTRPQRVTERFGKPCFGVTLTPQTLAYVYFGNVQGVRAAAISDADAEEAGVIYFAAPIEVDETEDVTAEDADLNTPDQFAEIMLPMVRR